MLDGQAEQVAEIVPSPKISQRCRLVNSEYGDSGGVCSALLSPWSDPDSGSIFETSEVSCFNSCSDEEAMGVYLSSSDADRIQSLSKQFLTL